MFISTYIRPSNLIRSTASLIIGLSIFSAKASMAAIINGGFETGNSTGWATIGSTNVEGKDVDAPTEGSFQMALTTISTFNDGIRSNAVTVNDLEAFLGLSSESLSKLGNGNAFRGSAIKQTFTGNAGEILSFDWSFGTTEDTPSSNNDFAFILLNPNNLLEVLADTNYPELIPIPTPIGVAKETGYKNLKFPLSKTTTYTLAIGLVHLGNGMKDSGLFVDNVKLNFTPVPEPSSAFTLTVATLGTAFLLKIKNHNLRR